jgi:hypothetical protein
LSAAQSLTSVIICSPLRSGGCPLGGAGGGVHVRNALHSHHWLQMALDAYELFAEVDFVVSALDFNRGAALPRRSANYGTETRLSPSITCGLPTYRSRMTA